jgi:3-deoxy-manno-octulosonate cytidylyltransferase (CMP-KDO synthetase)
MLFISAEALFLIKEMKMNPEYFLHVGVYAYKKEVLMNFTKWLQSSLEKIEKLEQLRYLENGIKIKMAETEYNNIAIDTPEDLERAKSSL